MTTLVRAALESLIRSGERLTLARKNMAAACDLYSPKGVRIPVADLLREGGLEVEARPVQLADGTTGTSFRIERDRVRVNEAPPTPELDFHSYLCLAPRKHFDLLDRVVAILRSAGATESPPGSAWH